MKRKLLLPIISCLLLSSCSSDLLDKLLNSEESTDLEESKSESGTNNDENGSNTNLKRYKIKFTNFDGSKLEEKRVKEGEVPTTELKPKRESDAQYDYTFTGWEPQLYAADKDETYKATYSSTIREYKVSFYNNDGSELLDEQTVKYGEKPTYKTLGDIGTYKHVGYSKNKDSQVATITKSSDFDQVADDTNVYYAVYQEKTYNLLFYLDENKSKSKTITVPINTTVNLNDYPEIVAECKTYFMQKQFKYYEFECWYNGTLNKDQMIGKQTSGISSSNKGIKVATKDTYYFPMFKEVDLNTKYPNGYITYKKQSNTNAISVMSWEELVSDEYISLSSDGKIIKGTDKLKELYSVYLIVNPSIEQVDSNGFLNFTNLRYFNVSSGTSNTSFKLLNNYCFAGCTNLMADTGSYFYLPPKLTALRMGVFARTQINQLTYEGTSLNTIATSAFEDMASANSIITVSLFSMTQNDFKTKVNLENNWLGNKKVRFVFNGNTELRYGYE